MASTLKAFDSVKPDLRSGIKSGLLNPVEIGNQSTRFVEPGGFTFASPYMPIESFDGILQDLVYEGEFGSKYDHVPDIMSYELYGTHDLWWLLMRANGAMHRAQFVGPKLRFFGTTTAGGPLLEVLAAARARVQKSKVVETTDLTIRTVF